MNIRHELKIVTGPFEEVKAGVKTAEFRRNDRGYQVGDWCLLREWLPESQTYTGRDILIRVTCITTGYGIPDGYAMLSFKADGGAP